MAMTVEMSELLEHFQWMNPEDVRALMDGKNPEKTALIAEEFADIMMYGMQLARTLGIDVAHQIERKIDIVDHRPAKKDEPKR
jgi:NTP pyrophosphatase (non-canonical NTP hydrolase)